MPIMLFHISTLEASRPLVRRLATLTLMIGAALSLTACGGGGGGGQTTTGETAAGADASTRVVVADAKPATRLEAARFLTQATFGPTDSDITRVMSLGYRPWITEQMQMPMASPSHRAYWQQRNTAIMAANSRLRANGVDVTNSFWRHAISGQDQLRQRMAFALSQIFVVSLADGCGADQSEGVASYLDMLSQRAFGSYRELLEAVALHPIMGCYLSHLKNQKEDSVTGRVPDENFAREIMQLFSIGLHQLNMDGTAKLDANGRPIETYSPADVSGLAKVFTGFSWECPGWPQDRCFKWGDRDGDYAKSPDRWTAPMRGYPQFHSTSEKRFLGAVIPPQSTPDPAASLKRALDTIAAHPNVAPFISRQIIQRFVTSNPSPAYVQRVATAFKNGGLNFGVLIQAVLTDPEALAAPTASATAGKVREPVLRFTALLRAYGARSDSGEFLIGYTSDPARTLGQSPMMAPSVFNFYRPGYTPPGTQTAAAGVVSPEQQLLHETSAAGYVNFMKNTIAVGVGAKGHAGTASRSDVQLEYNVNPSSSNLALADNPTALVESINEKLMYGTMPADRKADIAAAIATVDYRAATNPTADQIFNTRQRRVWGALLLAVAIPEYQVQQ